MVYFSKSPYVKCKDTCVGDTDQRIIEHITDYNKRNQNSHILKHSCGSNHSHVWRNNLKILNSNYRNNIKGSLVKHFNIQTDKEKNSFHSQDT